ncbi:MAG: hypothetical protein J0L82_17215 [Deltaproteobacteria bacterium]|jgi:hypothetical protein|nr:hypothetical protein [Deltaproteobacteria bacterium]
MKFARIFVLTFAVFNLISDSTHAETVKAVKGGSASGSKLSLTDDEKANGAVLSPYEACQSFIFVSHSTYQSPYWQNRPKACDTKKANCQLKVQVIPDGNMFGSFKGQAGLNMSSAVTATAFLEGVREDALKLVTRGISDREATLSKCNANSSGVECKAYLSKVQAGLKKNETDFRNVVSVLTEPSNADLLRVITTNDVSSIINRSLRKGLGPIRTLVDIPKMPALSDAEFAKVKAELTGVLETARKEWKDEVEVTIKKRLASGMPASEADVARRNLMKDENFQTKLRRSISEFQSKKLEVYDRIVQEVPEMPFIGIASAEIPMVLMGQGKVIEQLKKAQDTMGKSLKPEDLKSEARLPEVLQYAALKRVIDARLEKEVQSGSAASSCAVATTVHQRMKEIQDRNRLIMAGATIGGVVAGGFAGLGLLGAGAVGSGTAMAFAAGATGTLSNIHYESTIKRDLEVSAAAGLADPKDVREQVSVVAFATALAPLDFIGVGAVASGAVVAAKNSSRIAAALGDGVVGKFVAASIATKKLGTTGGVNSAEVVGLLQTLEKAESGSAEAVKATNKLKLAVDNASKAALGRSPSADDERALKALADGYLGTVAQPNAVILTDYATITKGMSPSEIKAYADRLEAVKATAKAGGSSETVDPARTVAAGRLAVALAAEPEFKAAAEILQAKSGWGQRAIENFREVVVAAIALAKGAGRASKEAVSTRFKKALAKITGESPDSPRVQTLCNCGGMCPVGAGLDVENAEPVYVACVNRTNLPTNLITDLPTDLRSMSEASAH